MSMTQTDLEAGLSAQRHGQSADAEASYRRVLEREPNDPDAVHLLGMVCQETGRVDEALRLLQRAVGHTKGDKFHFKTQIPILIIIAAADSIGARPHGLNVFSNPSRTAALACQSGSPSGLPPHRFNLNASSSFADCRVSSGLFTRADSPPGAAPAIL